MKFLAALIISVMGYAFAVFAGILVQMHGWGLQPKSWWWIILGNLVGVIIAQFFLLTGKAVLDD